MRRNVDAWWPPGHLLGYEHGFINQVADMMYALGGKQPTVPLPNFEITDAGAGTVLVNRWGHGWSLTRQDRNNLLYVLKGKHDERLFPVQCDNPDPGVQVHQRRALQSSDRPNRCGENGGGRIVKSREDGGETRSVSRPRILSHEQAI